MNRKKILILGGTGMLGSMLASYLSYCGHDITISERKTSATAYKTLIFDAISDEIYFDISQYDWVINCIGVIKQKNNVEPKEYYSINSVFPWKLALEAALKNVKLIHISSDCVFDGTINENLSYSADDKPNAKDDYGYSKALGEPKNCIVLRTSIIGPLKNNSNGLFEWFRNNKEEKVGGYPNHFWSGVTTLELSKVINAVIEKNYYYNPYDKQENVFQVSLERSISKFHLLALINEVFSLKKDLYENKTVAPVNRSLDNNLSDLCSYQINKIEDQLIQLKNWEKKCQS